MKNLEQKRHRWSSILNHHIIIFIVIVKHSWAFTYWMHWWMSVCLCLSDPIFISSNNRSIILNLNTLFMIIFRHSQMMMMIPQVHKVKLKLKTHTIYFYDYYLISTHTHTLTLHEWKSFVFIFFKFFFCWHIWMILMSLFECRYLFIIPRHCGKKERIVGLFNCVWLLLLCHFAKYTDCFLLYFLFMNWKREEKNTDKWTTTFAHLKK